MISKICITLVFRSRMLIIQESLANIVALLSSKRRIKNLKSSTPRTMKLLPNCFNCKSVMRSCVDIYIKSGESRPSGRLRIVIFRFQSLKISKIMCPGTYSSKTHTARLSTTATLTQSFHSLTSLKRISLSHSFNHQLVSVHNSQWMRLDSKKLIICSSKLKNPNGACYHRSKEINMMQSATLDIVYAIWISILLTLKNRTL